MCWFNLTSNQAFRAKGRHIIEDGSGQVPDHKPPQVRDVENLVDLQFMKLGSVSSIQRRIAAHSEASPCAPSALTLILSRVL